MKTLYVGRPNVGSVGDVLERVKRILESRWLTNAGPVVQEFERRIADYLGVRHFVATCNATVGLEIAARALGLTGEVIVPAWTFVATAHAMSWVGLEPVFCDVRGDHNIDVGKAAALVSARTSAIVPVHVWGRPADTMALWHLAQEHGLKLIYDAAHAFGVPALAGCGDCSIYSFHATKVFNTLEGGGIATNDDLLAKRCRAMKAFGFAGEDNIVSVGTNGKMNEVCAAVGLVNLEHVDEFIEHNRHIYQVYRSGLDTVAGFVHDPLPGGSNYHYVVYEVPRRDEMLAYLRQNGVMARRYFYPGIHKVPPYESKQELPVTDYLAAHTLVLPSGTQMTTDDARQVCDLIRTEASR